MSEQESPPIRMVSRANEEFSASSSFGFGTARWYSFRSPYKDSDNEDAAAIIEIDEDRAILAVADGVGGQPGGASAAEVALRCLVEAAEKIRRSDTTIRPAIMEGIECANHEILDQGIGAATTLAVVEIAGDAMRPYHVGDSMILVVGQRGKLRHQTVPHSPVGYAVEAGLIDEHEAIHHEDRHVVSNVVGSPNMRIEVGSTLRLKPRDTVLLASDGIFDNLHVREVVELIRKGPLDRVMMNLADGAKERMHAPEPGHPSKPDDTTFILYRPTHAETIQPASPNRSTSNAVGSARR